MFGFIKDMIGKSGNQTTTNSNKTEGQQQKPEQPKPQDTASNNKPEANKPKSDNKSETNDKKVKAKIYNLIIVDESGSMSHLCDATLSGVNETISMLKSAQQELSDTQQHYLTLVTFDERGHNKESVRELVSAKPIDQVSEFSNYHPNGCTPLYDAMGQSLSKLHSMIKDDEDATGSVTILTDGLENASREWTADHLRQLIDKLKELGWSFSYMGSAHNVKDVADLLSIDNIVEFSHDVMGARATWQRERSSKMAYLRNVGKFYCEEQLHATTAEEKRSRKRHMAANYYANRVTPDNLSNIVANDIIVVFGNTAGLNGNTYTIPHTDIIEDVRNFVRFAYHHSDKRFLLPHDTIQEIYNVFHYPQNKDIIDILIEVENICLPEQDWEVLGLKMN